MSQNSKVTVIKLGGSVISREDCLFDFGYMNKLKELLLPEIQQGHKFGIVLGGGFVMRKYRDLARSEGGIEKVTDLHWIGTTVNVLHAEIARTCFAELAMDRPFMYEDYYDQGKFEMTKPVLFGGGGRPGHSGDVDAILLAQKIGARNIVSFKNIDYLYSADPRLDPNAEIVKLCTWDRYNEIIGGETIHAPGANYVVDPVASRMAKQANMSFVILKGDNLDNFERYLNHGEFEGSLIKS